MPEQQRNGIIYLDFCAMKVNNMSLGRAPQPFHSVRMKPLGQLGVNRQKIIRGNELTFDLLGSLQIPWGTAKNVVILDSGGAPINLTTPQSGWLYTWFLGEGRFVISNTGGTVATVTANSISELGVSWDILADSKFSIVLTAGFDNPAFLIGRRVPTSRKIELSGIIWGLVDNYLSGIQHIIYNQMSYYYAWQVPNGKPSADDNGDPLDPNISPDDSDNFYVFDGFFWTASILLIRDYLSRDMLGAYPANIVKGSDSQSAQQFAKVRDGQRAQVGEVLLIRLFAARMLTNSSPYIAPWLLWKLFQWTYSKPYVENRERIEDLSPMW